MADPFRTTGNEDSKTNFYGNAGLQAGYRTSIDRNDPVIVFGPRVEGGFQRGGWHGNVGLGVGTAVTADAEIGYEFNFNKTFGLDLTANASNTTSLLGKNRSTIIAYKDDSTPTPIPISDSKTWRSNITEAGAKAMLNINPNDRVQIGVGVSGQYVRNNAPDHTFAGVTQALHKKDFKFSPEFALDIKAGKNVTIGAEANSRGGNATVAWNF